MLIRLLHSFFGIVMIGLLFPFQTLDTHALFIF
jgi:hypothetical protein